jgi:serine/threonine protein phosphatase PrpC
MEMLLHIATRTERGARDYNDDVVLTTGRCVVLADGMGGHTGGAAAATVAASACMQHLHTISEDAIRRGFVAAQHAVRALQFEQAEFSEAGCTLTVVAVRLLPVRGVSALVAHVGDSPAFKVTDDDLELLTRPHTVADQLEREGRISAEEATRHRGRHTLTRAVGSVTINSPDVREVDLEEGDRLLLASDGLLDVPDRRELRRLATQPRPAAAVVDDLVDFALLHSNDNTTVAIIDPWAEVDTTRGGSHI